MERKSCRGGKLRLFLSIIMSLTFTFAASCQSALSQFEIESSASAQNKSRPTVALALGGGGMRGAAHIGVLRVFEEEKIPIDYIVGTSMGALVGGLYCAGMSPDQIEKKFENRKIQHAFVPRSIFLQVLLQPIFKILHILTKHPPAGLFDGKHVERFFKKNLPEDKNDFAALRIPFAAVVTDLRRGTTVALNKGSLGRAVRASCSLPIFMRPVLMNDTLYIDGGIRGSTPIKEALRTKADLVIGVQVIDYDLPLKRNSDFKSYLPIIESSFNTAMLELAEVERQTADLTIHPKFRNVTMFDRDPASARMAIKAGEKAARDALPAIRALINKDQRQARRNRQGLKEGI